MNQWGPMAQREQRNKKWNRANDKTLHFEDTLGYASGDSTLINTTEFKRPLLALTALKRISATFEEEFVAMKAGKVQWKIWRIRTNLSKIACKALSSGFRSNHASRFQVELHMSLKPHFHLVVTGLFGLSDRCKEQSHGNIP